MRLAGMFGNAFDTLVMAILAILAPDLLTSIRMEYYGPVGSQADKEQLSWVVAAPTGSMNVELGAHRRKGSNNVQYSVIEDQEIDM